MRVIFFLLCSFLPEVVQAAFNEPLTLKRISEDGNQFIFVRKEGPPPWNGITIKDPDTKVILYEARVTKCNANSCLGIIVHNHSGVRLREDEEYFHSYNETPIKFKGSEVQTVTPPLRPVPRPEVKPPSEPKPSVAIPTLPPEEKEASRKSLYLGYGSPLGPALKLGYLKILPKAEWGGSYSNVFSTTNKVSIKAHVLSFLGTYTIFKFSFFDVNLVGEGGITKASLDFSGVDAEGPSVDKTTYLIGAAGELRYGLQPWSIGLKLGFSKTGLEKSYTNEFGDYNNPYGAVLAYLEIGAYYQF